MPSVLAVVGRTHLMLLHFPIAVLLAVLAIELLLRKRVPDDKRREVTGALLVVGAGGAVLAMATGLLFAKSEQFHGHTAALLAQHRNGGIVSAVLALAALVAQRRQDLKAAYLPLLAVSCIAVAFTGHRGGAMVYGDGYVLEPLHKGHDKKDGDDDGDRVVASDGDDGKDDDARLRWPEGQIPDKPDYNKDIKPIFERSCVKCHGPEKRKSGLRLDKKRFAMKGGETGLAIVPGDVAKSLVCKYIQLPDDDDDVMPSKGKLLAQSEIETLKKWVAQGAEWPDDVDTPIPQ